jgi:hypothetical protein
MKFDADGDCGTFFFLARVASDMRGSGKRYSSRALFDAVDGARSGMRFAGDHYKNAPCSHGTTRKSLSRRDVLDEKVLVRVIRWLMLGI